MHISRDNFENNYDDEKNDDRRNHLQPDRMFNADEWKKPRHERRKRHRQNRAEQKSNERNRDANRARA